MNSKLGTSKENLGVAHITHLRIEIIRNRVRSPAAVSFTLSCHKGQNVKVTLSCEIAS